jgi:hypothetical protein
MVLNTLYTACEVLRTNVIISIMPKISPLTKRESDLALTLRELEDAYGLSYERVKRLAGLPGFPLVEGVVIPSDFDFWRRERIQHQLAHEAPKHHVGHTAYAPAR